MLRAILLSALVSVRAGAQPTSPRTATDSGASGLDAGADPRDSDPALVESRGHEREEHLRQAKVFEARAALERDLAKKEKKPDVKQQMLEEADRLSTLARKETQLVGNSKE